MRKLITVITACLLILAVSIFATWPLLHVQVDGKWYSRFATKLNVLEEDFSFAQYRSLRKAFPEEEILWSVPFQDGTLPSDSREIRISSLKEEDLKALEYLPELETVDARACRDYDALLLLQEQYPDCQVLYNVVLDGQEYAFTDTEVAVAHLTEEELPLLQLMPGLETVDGRDCRDYDVLTKVRECCPGVQVLTTVEIGGKEYPADTREITLSKPVLEELPDRLVWLTGLKKLTLHNPTGDAAVLMELKRLLPDAEIFWDVEIGGLALDSTMTELDLSGQKGLTIEKIREIIAWMPQVEEVFLGECDINGEMLAKLRDEVRQECKLIWTVTLGYFRLRTDAESFDSTRFGYYMFQDQQAFNLRYCEDLVALNLSRTYLTDLNFLKFMPHLKYLDLSASTMTDFTPLRYCTELELLDLESTYIHDYAPLVSCTSLKDLNVSRQWGSSGPLLKMTWLENLWCANSALLLQDDLRKGMPESVHVNTQISSIPGAGWQELPRYKEMKKLLQESLTTP